MKVITPKPLISSRTPKELRTKLFKATKIIAPKTAVKWLRAAEKLFLEEPKRLYMDSWGIPFRKGDKLFLSTAESQDSIVLTDRQRPACGTAACIAGHVMLAIPKLRKTLPVERIMVKGKVAYEAFSEFPYETGEIVRKALFLTHYQADRLFAPPDTHFCNTGDELGWGEVFREAYSKAKSPKERAYVTANRVESFLEELK